MKPIRTDEDLDAALTRLEEIFDAEPGSVEDDELRGCLQSESGWG